MDSEVKSEKSKMRAGADFKKYVHQFVVFLPKLLFSLKHNLVVSLKSCATPFDF
jgi:hypothetical protein